MAPKIYVHVLIPTAVTVSYKETGTIGRNLNDSGQPFHFIEEVTGWQTAEVRSLDHPFG